MRAPCQPRDAAAPRFLQAGSGSADPAIWGEYPHCLRKTNTRPATHRAPAPLTAMQVQELENSTQLDATTRKLIDRDNALRLFPAHAGSGEKVSPAPLPGPMPMKMRINRAMMKPVVVLANRMRDR